MAAKKGTQNKKTTAQKAKKVAQDNTGTIAVIAGATVAAVVGAVYFYGKEGKKRRTELKSWMVKAKAEVMEKIEKTKELGEDDYQKVIDTVLKKYKKLKDVKNNEIDELADDLKKGWKEISATIKKTTSTAKRVKKNTKVASKKVASVAGKKKAPAAKKKATAKKK
jgi:hypothetical protein